MKYKKWWWYLITLVIIVIIGTCPLVPLLISGCMNNCPHGGGNCPNLVFGWLLMFSIPIASLLTIALVIFFVVDLIAFIVKGKKEDGGIKEGTVQKISKGKATIRRKS